MERAPQLASVPSHIYCCCIYFDLMTQKKNRIVFCESKGQSYLAEKTNEFWKRVYLRKRVVNQQMGCQHKLSMKSIPFGTVLFSLNKQAREKCQLYELPEHIMKGIEAVKSNGAGRTFNVEVIDNSNIVLQNMIKWYCRNA